MYTQYPDFIKRDDGAYIPLDPLNADYAAFLDWLAQGNTPDMPPEPTHAELVEKAKAEIRIERQPIITICDGLQASFLTKGDLATATVIETAKQALRDLTKIDLSACTTYAEMKTVTLARYAQIASASPALKTAFSEAIK